MAREDKDVCPGCGRHCPASRVRCKYGQKHFAKKEKNKEENWTHRKKTDTQKHPRKWEKHVAQGGLVWKLVRAGGESKRALKRKSLTELEIAALLDEQEQAQLDALLGKLLKAFR